MTSMSWCWYLSTSLTCNSILYSTLITTLMEITLIMYTCNSHSELYFINNFTTFPPKVAILKYIVRLMHTWQLLYILVGSHCSIFLSLKYDTKTNRSTALRRRWLDIWLAFQALAIRFLNTFFTDEMKAARRSGGTKTQANTRRIKHRVFSLPYCELLVKFSPRQLCT